MWKLFNKIKSLKGQASGGRFFNNYLIMQSMFSIDSLVFCRQVVILLSSSFDLVSLLDHVDFTNFGIFFMVLLSIPRTQNNNQNKIHIDPNKWGKYHLKRVASIP
jgi:hypothetical protein